MAKGRGEGRKRRRGKDGGRERERKIESSCYKVLTDCCTANYIYRLYNTGRLHSALASSQEE